MAFQPNFPPGASGSADTTHPAGTSSMLPYINPWMPCSMPWTMENPPQLVRFGEELDIQRESHDMSRTKLRLVKRKSDLNFNPKPAKMHITEEKMAAQLKNMHISNNYVGEQQQQKQIMSQLWRLQYPFPFVDHKHREGQVHNCKVKSFGDALEKNDCMLPTLVLSKEVQSLTQSFQEPLLPETLFPKMERSTRALVLWKPPAGSITSQIISNLRSPDEEEEVDSLNNNSTTPDLNAMTLPGFSSSSTEMELS